MGAGTSALCAAGDPGGYMRPMPVETSEGLRHERISAWSVGDDDGPACAAAACAPPHRPLTGVLADTAEGAIVLEDRQEGPFWREDTEEALSEDGATASERATCDSGLPKEDALPGGPPLQKRGQGTLALGDVRTAPSPAARTSSRRRDPRAGAGAGG
mmetsp:Transcript_3695/g.11632  ORF Transcript_3695/g.11632 Transcript_3695/m.11632 type:complete len:158 (-) Transcript_3695:92-565(-)